jgi:hypothetical protein
VSYQLIEDYTLGFTGGKLDPKGWAIHHWGDPNQRPTFMGILNVLLERSRLKQASVNFMAEANKVACLVDPFTIAWGQGDGAYGWGNNNLVSLECNPRCSPEDRETVAELIADQNIRNGIPIILYPHKNFTATACPGLWEQWIPWLTERAKQIVSEKTSGKKEDVMNAEQERKLNAIYDRVFGRDVQRWFNPETLEVIFEARDGFIPARSTDIHDVIATNNLVISQTNKILDAVSKVPGVDPTMIQVLRDELKTELKAATSNLTVVLKSE